MSILSLNRQERLLQLPAAAFFWLLWFCPQELPCGHAFAKGRWEVSNAAFEVNVVKALELELRGPPLVPKVAPLPGTRGLKEKLTSVLQRAEQLVESQLSNVLRDFRQVGPEGQVPKRSAWFWNQSDERALKCALRSRSLLEASSILRRCAGKLQNWEDGTPLVALGMTCHLHCCLAECNKLLAGDLELEVKGEPSNPSDSESEEELDEQMSRGIPAKIFAKSKSLGIRLAGASLD